MALLGISARLVDGTRGRVGEEGWEGRVVEKIAFQVRILSSPPFSVTYRDALGLHYTRNYLSMCSVTFFFFSFRSRRF